MNIPKIIHQIWIGPNKRPDIWMNSWKINYINIISAVCETNSLIENVD